MKNTPKVLTFVSSLGMIQNGDYVNFNYPHNLLTEMSNAVRQKDLQKLLIQSHFTLAKSVQHGSFGRYTRISRTDWPNPNIPLGPGISSKRCTSEN